MYFNILFFEWGLRSISCKKKVSIPTKEDIDLLINKDIIERDSYYLSKLIGEKIVQLSGLKYIILRPHNIYGPHMGFKHVISELIKKMQPTKNNKNRTCQIFSPNHTRSFCYIDDAIKQIKNISFNKNSHNKIINIGNSKEEINSIRSHMQRNGYYTDATIK